LIEKSAHHHLFIQGDGEEDLSLGTHLAIGAHPDDLEIMAGPLIEECLEDARKKLVGVVCTHGVSDSFLSENSKPLISKKIDVRRTEQLKAAELGGYFAVVQLGHSSGAVKDTSFSLLKEQLTALINTIKPQTVYTHNPFDRHQTHRAIFRNVFETLKDSHYSPEEFLGCEVWRGLDWIDSEKKRALSIKNPAFIEKLISCFSSQQDSQRDYALGLRSRLKANQTFNDAYNFLESDHILYALDLKHLLEKKTQVKLSHALAEFIDPLLAELIKDYDI
jgi:LmbE family N-acetylglucosaminyl deacetylase